jgi:V-type H+-transporting ATPase subunit C
LQTTPKQSKNVKKTLDSRYSYLAGNALGRDKKGRVKQDDSAIASDMQAAGQAGEDYTAYVLYEFEIS